MGGRRLISIQKQSVYFLEMLHLKEINKIFHGKKTNGHKIRFIVKRRY